MRVNKQDVSERIVNILGGCNIDYIRSKKKFILQSSKIFTIPPEIPCIYKEIYI